MVLFFDRLKVIPSDECTQVGSRHTEVLYAVTISTLCWSIGQQAIVDWDWLIPVTTRRGAGNNHRTSTVVALHGESSAITEEMITVILP